jgi:hypothetical protein
MASAGPRSPTETLLLTDNMNSPMRLTFRLFAFVLALGLGASVFAQTNAPAPGAPRKDRVFLKDIEGIWINEQYIKSLTQLRSPHAAARKTPPLVIVIKREGRAWPIVVTDFNRASMQAVLDVEPEAKADTWRLVIGPSDRPASADEVKYVPFQGARNAQGGFDRLRIAEPTFLKGKWGDFLPLKGELNPAINRTVIAGKYKDAQGRDWEFAESGEATWPEQKFFYELSLNDPSAGCDYLQTEDLREGEDKKRFGYAWKAGKLSIFAARLAGKRVVCEEKKPLAVLTPQ